MGEKPTLAPWLGAFSLSCPLDPRGLSHNPRPRNIGSLHGLAETS